jgi:uncharacterized membrane protein
VPPDWPGSWLLRCFVVVGIAWTGHRDLFALISLTDRNLVWLNLLYMLPLTLLPFGAALISGKGCADHLRPLAGCSRAHPAGNLGLRN